MNANGNVATLHRLSTDEARTIGRKGGWASGRKRRERKLLREELIELLRTGDTQERICAALIEKALEGDIRAFQVIRDTVDGKPVDVVQLGSEKDNEVHFTFTMMTEDGKELPVPDELMG